MIDIDNIGSFFAVFGTLFFGVGMFAAGVIYVKIFGHHWKK